MKKIILILFTLLFGISLYAKPVFKRYPFKSGIILYDINTSGIGEGLMTHSVGISRFVFDDWGAKELKEDDVTEIQKGDFNEKIYRHTMSKMDYGTIYTVDFDENVTYQTRDKSIDMAIAQGQDLSTESIDLLKDMKAVQTGTDNVAGYKCDLWRLKDQTMCMYKGIPLKISIDAPGFTSTRTAQIILFDKPIAPKEFRLPGFAVVIDKDYTSNLSAQTNTEDYLKAIETLRQKAPSIGINLDDQNLTLTKEQENEVINTLGADYLKKQKRLLPKLLVALKGARECINHSESGKDARDCLAASNKIDEELGDQTRDYDFGHWDQALKAKIDSDIKQEIKDLDITIDCIKRYNKTTKVIECTEGSTGL